MLIKVCGITNSTEHSTLFEHPGIDFFGTIQFPDSKRFFPGEIATNKPVIGVFVDSTLDEIISKVEAFHLKGVQLHGSEPPELFANLPEELVLIKSISVGSIADISGIQCYEGLIDYFLFDTKTDQYGGSGKQFNWDILQYYSGSTPFLLSGGIGPNDIPAIQQITHPLFSGIDINSCFELEPGKKDALLIETFINELT